MTVSTLCSHEDFLKCLYVVTIKMLVNIRASEHLVESFLFCCVEAEMVIALSGGMKGSGKKAVYFMLSIAQSVSWRPACIT